MSEKRTFLVVHGWGGNKPEHWQEHLKGALTAAGYDVRAPQMPSPQSPKLEAWLNRLEEEIGNVPSAERLTVLAHSLGAITWMHYAAEVDNRKADRVLLIAPPYVMPGCPPTDAPPGVESFFPPPLDSAAIRLAARETHIIASDNDDYATFEQSKAYADRLDTPIHLLSGAGHISPYWGYGDWPWVLDWCLDRADFPPLVRAVDPPSG